MGGETVTEDWNQVMRFTIKHKKTGEQGWADYGFLSIYSKWKGKDPRELKVGETCEVLVTDKPEDRNDVPLGLYTIQRTE